MENTAPANMVSLPISKTPKPTLPVPQEFASRHMMPSMSHSITAQPLGNLRKLQHGHPPHSAPDESGEPVPQAG